MYILNVISDCQCDKVFVRLTNGALKAQSSREGMYEKSELINGKTSWISDSQAIWYAPGPKVWCIGTIGLYILQKNLALQIFTAKLLI